VPAAAAMAISGTPSHVSSLSVRKNPVKVD
jgi:hypothetical protein